jgi:hypothetical protein
VKNIGIIGTRKRDNPSAFKLVEQKFLEIYEEGDWIVSGGAKKGADRFAEQISNKYGVPRLIFPPDYKKYGSPAALFIRNGVVAEHSHVIVACVVRPEEGIEEVLKRPRGGTENTLKQYFKFNKVKHEVHLV